jgi:hypothetical protein
MAAANAPPPEPMIAKSKSDTAVSDVVASDMNPPEKLWMPEPVLDKNVRDLLVLYPVCTFP